MYEQYNRPEDVADSPVTPAGDISKPNGHVTNADRTEAFLKFHAKNPQVYTTLRRVSFEWLEAGKKRAGIDLFYGQCRWVLSLRIKGDGLFDLNNNHRSFYAHALMHYEPELRGLFETRSTSKAAREWIAAVRRGDEPGIDVTGTEVAA